MQCAVYSVKYTVFSVKFAVFGVQCSVCSLQFAVCIGQCKVIKHSTIFLGRKGKSSFKYEKGCRKEENEEAAAVHP